MSVDFNYNSKWVFNIAHFERLIIRIVTDLEKDGLISRKGFPVVPTRMKYRLTNRVQSLEDILRGLDNINLIPKRFAKLGNFFYIQSRNLIWPLICVCF